MYNIYRESTGGARAEERKPRPTEETSESPPINMGGKARGAEGSGGPTDRPKDRPTDRPNRPTGGADRERTGGQETDGKARSSFSDR